MSLQIIRLYDSTNAQAQRDSYHVDVVCAHDERDTILSALCHSQFLDLLKQSSELGSNSPSDDPHGRKKLWSNLHEYFSSVQLGGGRTLGTINWTLPPNPGLGRTEAQSDTEQWACTLAWNETRQGYTCTLHCDISLARFCEKVERNEERPVAPAVPHGLEGDHRGTRVTPFCVTRASKDRKVCSVWFKCRDTPEDVQAVMQALQQDTFASIAIPRIGTLPHESTTLACPQTIDLTFKQAWQKRLLKRNATHRPPVPLRWDGRLTTRTLQNSRDRTCERIFQAALWRSEDGQLQIGEPVMNKLFDDKSKMLEPDVSSSTTECLSPDPGCASTPGWSDIQPIDAHLAVPDQEVELDTWRAGLLMDLTDTCGTQAYRGIDATSAMQFGQFVDAAKAIQPSVSPQGDLCGQATVYEQEYLPGYGYGDCWSVCAAAYPWDFQITNEAQDCPEQRAMVSESAGEI